MTRLKLLICTTFVCMCLFCITGCTGTSTQTAQHNNSVALQEQELCAIPLDSITSQAVQYMQFANDSILAFLNQPPRNICLYNMKSGETNKIPLFADGPNAVHGIDAFCYVSPDSIWLFASWGVKLTLIDSNGVVKDKRVVPCDYNPSGEILRYAVSPFPLPTTPYLVRNGIHYLQGMGKSNVLDGQTPGVSLMYNENDSACQTANPYPAIYGTPDDFRDLSLFGYRHSSYALSPAGEIVTSFPAVDSITVYNPATDKSSTYFAGYSKPTNIKLMKVKDQESEYTDLLSQYQYCAILYDPYNKLYYRILRMPKPDFDMDNLSIEFAKKPNTVIILNDKFEKVGETLLPDDAYYPVNAFVSEKGLHINTLSDDDDFMTFRVFKPIECTE